VPLFSLSTISVTGFFYDSSLTGQSGAVLFYPTSVLTDSTGKVFLGTSPISAVVASGTMTAQTLVTTDNTALLPAGWQYTVTISVPGASQTFNTYLPSTLGASVDLSQLAPAEPVVTPSGTYVQSLNGYTGQVSVAYANGTLTVGPTA
jgi:hypothetical protein